MEAAEEGKKDIMKSVTRKESSSHMRASKREREGETCPRPIDSGWV